MVHTSSAAALATDQDNRLVCLNEEAGDLLETAVDGALGRPLGACLRARDVFGNRLCVDACALHAMVRNAQAVESFELDLLRKGGGTLRVSVSVVVVLDPRPRRYHLVYFLRPRRRRRKADEAIDVLLQGRRPGEPLSMRPGDGDDAALTRRQTEVLALIAKGKGSRQIAASLGISIHTVRNHTRTILQRLGVHSQAEAVSVALRRRLI